MLYLFVKTASENPYLFTHHQVLAKSLKKTAKIVVILPTPRVALLYRQSLMVFADCWIFDGTMREGMRCSSYKNSPSIEDKSPFTSLTATPKHQARLHTITSLYVTPCCADLAMDEEVHQFIMWVWNFTVGNVAFGHRLCAGFTLYYNQGGCVTSCTELGLEREIRLTGCLLSGNVTYAIRNTQYPMRVSSTFWNF